MDDETLKKFAYVISSKYRTETVKVLKDSPNIPTNIASDAGIRTNHVSKVLKELKDQDIVVCINENAKKGRLYRLTNIGDEIVENLK